jgi:thiamine biosynthesis protein ThiC
MLCYVTPKEHLGLPNKGHAGKAVEFVKRARRFITERSAYGLMFARG